MNNATRIFQQKRNNPGNRVTPKPRGFTLLEMVVAVAIIGIVSIVLYPSILNSLETRKLENSTREIMTTLQRAKFQAVKSRINHRVRFDFINQGEMDLWCYYVEREDTPGSWNSMPGFNRKFLPPNFNVTVNFPDQIVQFSPLGFISNYSSSQNSVSVQSDKLTRYNQPDQRVISVFVGGTVEYTKTQGGE
jgi:prepilin-type N-terminal cleavage/methylation domain-containing protein